MDYKHAVVDELHNPARRNYTRKKLNVSGVDKTW